MPRYELAESERFWEITFDERSFYTRYGRVGSDGTTTPRRRLQSAEALTREVEKRTAATVKKGYVAVPEPAPDEAVDPTFEKELRARPTDPELRRAYGAWLAEHGDRRGELAAANAEVSAANATAGRDALLKKHPTLLPDRFGKLLRKKRNPNKDPSGYCDVSWEGPFLASARVARNSERPPHTVRELCAELLAHPSARFLTDLTIGPLGPGDEYDYGEVARALIEAAPTTLRRLTLADFAPEHCELGWTVLGEVGPLGAALPGLEELVLRGGSVDLRGLAAPGLRALSVTIVDDAGLRALAEADWPALERLALHAGDAVIDAATLSQVLGRAPALRELSIEHTSETRALLDVVAAHPGAGRLQRLGLTDGSLGDEDLAALQTLGVAATNLQQLDLRGNFITEVEGLGDLCPDVSFEPQRRAAAGAVVTEAQISDFAPDARSVAAARKLADPGAWPKLGREVDTLWGNCQGRDVYEVFVDVNNFDAGCTCPSPKYPCKHTIALLMLAVADHPFEPTAVPEGLVERCGEGGRSW